MTVSAAIVIPARYDSSRFPGKPLALLQGKPMIEHVVRRAQRVAGVAQVLVATDDERIRAAVTGFGGQAVMTAPTHRTGSERVAEVARALDVEIIVNLQGDEPLIDPRAIEQALQPVQEGRAPMATLMTAAEPGDLTNPNVVKVVCDRQGYAMYFSRAPIPYPRAGATPAAFKHVGIYAYRRDFLLELYALPPTPLELAESLEQLRALENGYRIAVVHTPYPSFGVDTPEQLEQIRHQLEGESVRSSGQ